MANEINTKKENLTETKAVIAQSKKKAARDLVDDVKRAFKTFQQDNKASDKLDAKVDDAIHVLDNNSSKILQLKGNKEDLYSNLKQAKLCINEADDKNFQLKKNTAKYEKTKKRSDDRWVKKIEERASECLERSQIITQGVAKRSREVQGEGQDPKRARLQGGNPDLELEERI